MVRPPSIDESETHVIHRFILSWCFAFAPPPKYEDAHTRLSEATQSIAEVSPAQATVHIEAALSAMLEHPRSLLDDASAPEMLARARLALVWALVADGNLDAATSMMDTAIRSSPDPALPLAGLGPAVRQLHADRRKFLEDQGRATIAIDCEDCNVLVDEHRSENPTSPLLLGVHRVWVFDPQDRLEPRFVEVTLDRPDQVATVFYRTPPPILVDSTVVDTPVLEEPPVLRPGARSKTRYWPKLLGMAVGLGVGAAGGVLLGLDGRCRDGSSPSPANVDTQGCRQLWTTATTGYALIGVGGALFTGASAWLVVDAVHPKRHSTAMLAWTVRF
jgi:hypothetical protein